MPLIEQVLSTGDTETEAADLLGPVANPQQWRQRSDYGHIYEPDSRVGWHMHPEGVLGWFDMIVTKHLGHTRTQRITLASAAAYLDSNLHYLAADIEFDFADMGGAFESCRRHMELVLHDGEQVETGAPCMTCRVPLRRVYAGNELPWSHRDGSKPRTNEDVWACAKCREWRDDKGYRLNVSELHQNHAEWLTAAEVEEMTGVKAPALRKRVERGDLRSRRDSGRTVYDAAAIPEVTAHRDAMAG